MDTCERRMHLSATGFCGCALCQGGLNGGGQEAAALGRWIQTATNATTGDFGDPMTLTWGLVADGMSIPGSFGSPTAPSTLQARLGSVYGPSKNWLPLFQSVFDRWEAVSGVNYEYFGLADDGASFFSPGVLGVRPDVRIAGVPLGGVGGTIGLNIVRGGQMWLDTDDFGPGGAFLDTSNNSLRLRNTIAHELGHGLGMGHVSPNDGTKLMEAISSTLFDGPQFDDILGAQSLYGDPFEKNGRNETFTTASDLGQLFIGAPNAPISAWDHPFNPMLRSIANTGDVDYLKFTLTNPYTLDLTLSPYGPTYQMGYESVPEITFNASAQGDLDLQVIGSDGVTVLRNVAGQGLGGSESTNITLLPGTYYLRVSMSSGAGLPHNPRTTQPYNIRATITPPSVPNISSPLIQYDDDSGFSQSDNITNVNTPRIVGFAASGTAFDVVLSGPSGVTNFPVVADGTGIYRLETGLLADGTYTLQARAANAIGHIVPVGQPTTIVIDTAAPQITNINFDRSIQSVNIAYTELVIGGSPNAAVQLVNQTTGETFATLPDRPVPNVMSYLVDGWRLTDGRYVANYTNGSVADRAGNPAVNPSANPFLSFNFLRADFNNDSRVDFGDLLILAQNYGTIYGGSPNNTIGDANYDIQIDFNDLLILAQTYNQSLVNTLALRAAPGVGTRPRSTRDNSNERDLPGL